MSEASPSTVAPVQLAFPFYRVRLDIFEGPLDLLLHLIKKNEVEIAAIPVATITEQYLGHLEFMRDLNLDIAGEFLVMAATLMLIKSRELLPATEAEESEEPDPRAELVQQLIEYQRYREAALELSERPLLQRDVFRREAMPLAPEELAGLPEEPVRVRATSWDLLEAFRAILQRARPEPVHEVVQESVSLRDRIGEVLARLRDPRRVCFVELFPADASRLEIVVTFLAVLELMKMGAVQAWQEDGLAPITIELVAENIEEVRFGSVDDYDGATSATPSPADDDPAPDAGGEDGGNDGVA